MVIWPWVRVVAEDGDLNHVNMILFIMNKGDLVDEIDHSYNIFMHQLISNFIHLRKAIQSYEILQDNYPLYKKDNNMDSTDESETSFLEDGLESLGCTLRRVKHEVDI